MRRSVWPDRFWGGDGRTNRRGSLRCGGRRYSLPPRFRFSIEWSRHRDNRKPFRGLREVLRPSPLPRPCPAGIGARSPVRLPVLLRSRFDLLLHGQLHKTGRSMNRRDRLIQKPERFGVGIPGELRFYRRKESFQAAELIVDRGRFITAVHHAVGAFGITGFSAVFMPLRGFHKFGERVRVTVLQKITGFLPAEKVKGRHAPGSAGVMALAHQEFEKERRHVE